MVELKNLNPDILTTIVDFIYTAEITLSTDSVQSICSACDELQLEELKEGCDEFMCERVEPANCLGLYVFSKLYNLKLTLKASYQCMLTKLKDILRLALDPELKLFNEENMIAYISDDNLEVENESLVFELVEKWVGADPINREDGVDKIMEHVRLAFCSPTYLCCVVEKSPIMQSRNCLLLLLEAKTYQLVPKERQSMVSARTKPRKCDKQWLLFDADNSAEGKCWCFNDNEGNWKEFTKLPVQGLSVFKACMSQNEIIVTGGRSPSTLQSTWALDLLEKKWKSLPPMTESRCCHAMVVVGGGEVYTMGGYKDGTGGISSVEKLDARRQQWTQAAPMKTELYYHGAVNLDQHIFVMGGTGNSNLYPKFTQVYNVTNNQWKIQADMPEPCMNGSAAVLNGKIYVVGSGTRCSMSYDPVQNTWSTHSRPIQSREACFATVWKGKLLLCGGSGRNDGEEYDADKDQWTPWQVSLPAGLNYHTMLSGNF